MIPCLTYSYTTLIQLKYSIGEIHHCVTVVRKSIFNSKPPFELPITTESWTNFALMISKQKKLMDTKN